MENALKNWNLFLASLSTRGGAIFLLTVIFIIGICVSIHLIHHNEGGSPLAATLMASFASFSGALLIGLKATSEGGAATVTTSNTATTATASTTEAAK